MDTGTELPRSSGRGDRAGSHAIYLYDGRVESPLESAFRYVTTGIEAGDSIVLILPKPFLDEAVMTLRDVEASLPSGRLTISIPEDFYLEQGRFSLAKIAAKWRKLARIAGRGVSIRAFTVGDRKIAADIPSSLKLIEYESAVNRCFPLKMGVCCYDRSLFHSDIVKAAGKCHPFIWDGTSTQPNCSYMSPNMFFDEFYEHERRVFIWSAEPSSCREARHAVANIAARMPFDLQEIDDLVLAVGEAFTNAVRHGSPNGAKNNITVTVTPVENCITVDITDEGHGINCKPKKKKLNEPGGKGLHIMKQLCDHVEHFSRKPGCTIRLVKRSKRPRF